MTQQPPGPPLPNQPNLGMAIIFTQSGNPKSSLLNTKTAMHLLNVRARKDEFRDHILMDGVGLPPSYQGVVTDRCITWIRNKVLGAYNFDPGDDNVHAAIRGIAEEYRFNPVIDWLSALNWDGKARLRTWLPRITGSEDSELNRQAGARVILGMVARAFFPGSKFDLCVVLEGKQGCGKSTLARLLAGDECFTDAPGLLAMDMKARGELLAGCWVAELGELSGLSRTEVELVKATISQTHDHFRAAYERIAVKRPRTCIFIGTTNSESYLMDTTGSRRFLPVRCGENIDLGGFRLEREQLFAEAVMVLKGALQNVPHIYGQPLPAHVNLNLSRNLWQLAATAAEDRRIVDHGEDILRRLLDEAVASPTCKTQLSGLPFVASFDIHEALKCRLPHQPHARTVAQWMAKLGWRQARHGSGAGQLRGYERP